MKRLHKISLIVIMLALSLGYACEKIIEIDLEATEPRLVMNALITPDSGVSIVLSRSMHILDNHQVVRITNAMVKLYEDDVEVAQLQHVATGKYTTAYTPKLGKTYRIEASAENFDDISAMCNLPLPVVITGLDTTIIKDEYSQAMLAFDVSFSDPAGESNYYMLEAFLRYTYEEYDPWGFSIDTLYQNADTVIVDTTWGIYTMVERYEPVYLNSNDIILEAISSNYGGGLVFTDELINGKPYKIRATTYIWAYGEEMTLNVHLKSITRAYYMYMRTLSAHYSAQGDPFAEPVFVFSNVEGGMGIVGGYTISIDSIGLDPSAFNGGWWYYE